MSTAFTIIKLEERIGPGWFLDRCDRLDPPLRLLTVTAPDLLPLGIECQGVLLAGRGLDPARVVAKDPLVRALVVFVRSLVGLGVPYLGIDAGAQLLSLAMLGSLGPDLTPGPRWQNLPLTPEAGTDPLLGGCPGQAMTALGWPTPRCTLPKRGVLLAGTTEAPDTFRLGDRAWGILAHPELTTLALGDWLGEPAGAGASMGAVERAALLAEAEAREADQRAFAHDLMGSFLTLVSTFRHEEPPLAQLHPGPDHHKKN